jgi:hypothetical protein
LGHRSHKRAAKAPQAGLNNFCRRKLTALIPLLASDHDGEVVATVHAIRRMLQAAGLDLHTLAAILTAAPDEKPAAHEQPAAHPEPEPWRSTVLDLLRTHAECSLCLSRWDREFLGNLAGYYTKRPSAAQLDILDQIQRKAGELHHAA